MGLCHGERCSRRWRQVSPDLLRKHPAERRRSRETISGRSTGTVRGSCAQHWQAGWRVRARLRGGCVRAHVGERKGERESIRCSVQQLRADLVKCEICSFFDLLFPSPSTPTHTTYAGALSPFSVPFFYKSITCRCCGGYTKGYTVRGHHYSMSG